jgi:RNA polymerase sigma factor (sigma-70 family)
MATAFRTGTLELIQHLYDSGTCTGLSDARLLERFVTGREESAFAALVARHGAMVLNTCQAVLQDPNAADDVFQATFVLLFRKAGSIRECDALGGWLHRVAYRAALQARSDAARRRDVEKAACSRRVATDPALDDLRNVLHEEIERLPERFRLPVVLCDLEGVTRDQAADLLRSTEGAVRGRLAKGRELLRRRLTHRGFTIAVPFAAPADIPTSLVSATVHAAMGGASGTVAVLKTAASRGWALASLKAAAAALLGLGMAVAAFVYLGHGSAPQRKPTVPPKPIVTVTVVARPQEPAKTAAKAGVSTTPVEGRIVDLEGRPVAGATISVKYVLSPPEGKLDVWIDEVKRLAKQPFGLNTMADPGPHAPFSATSDRDGRFRIEGMPSDGIATAAISGPGIETSEVYILTRDVPTIRVKKPDLADAPMLIYYGARFDHVAAKARPIIGTIRDKDTGAPIAGVHITGMPNIQSSMIPTPGVEATSDAQGRYKITGLPTSSGFKLFTEAAAGQPYVNGGFVSTAKEPKPGPYTFDITLKRGVLVRGRLTDKVTGQPVQGAVTYYAMSDNSHLDEFPNFKRGSQITRVLIPGADGRFTIPALPGRGLIAARGPEDGYLHGLGAGAIKGFDRQMGAFRTAPFYCPTSDQHVLAEINPAAGTSEVTLELQVDPGRTVKGTIVGPDRRVVGGVVEIRTLDVFQGPRQTAMNSNAFTVTGLPSGRYRLDFFHRGRKLAGSITLNGDEKEGLTVKLQPWGTVIGRVVDETGKPRTDVQIFSTTREQPDPERGDLEVKPTVNAEGRFRIDGLVPGVKYDALGHSPQKADGPILQGVQVATGEIKDLGDVKLPTWKPDQN